MFGHLTHHVPIHRLEVHVRRHRRDNGARTDGVGSDSGTGIAHGSMLC